MWFGILIRFLVYSIVAWLEDYPGFGFFRDVKTVRKKMNLDFVCVIILSARSMALASAL